MAEAKKKEEIEKTPQKRITVYRGAAESAEILESDLPVWQKAGFTVEKPIAQLSIAEQWAALKRSTGANL